MYSFIYLKVINYHNLNDLCLSDAPYVNDLLWRLKLTALLVESFIFSTIRTKYYPDTHHVVVVFWWELFFHFFITIISIRFLFQRSQFCSSFPHTPICGVHFMASTLNQEGSMFWNNIHIFSLFNICLKCFSADIDIKYVQGLVKFSIQLPSRKEKCQFLLKSTTNTIFNLIHDLKLEDKGIDRVVAFNIGLLLNVTKFVLIYVFDRS